MPITTTTDDLGKFADHVRPHGWAGRGSGAVTPGACRNAAAFVAEARARCATLDEPRVGPSFAGGVGLQWDFDGASVLIRIHDDRELVIFCGGDVASPGGEEFVHPDGGIPTWAHALEKLAALCGGATA